MTSFAGAIWAGIVGIPALDYGAPPIGPEYAIITPRRPRPIGRKRVKKKKPPKQAGWRTVQQTIEDILDPFAWFHSHRKHDLHREAGLAYHGDLADIVSTIALTVAAGRRTAIVLQALWTMFTTPALPVIIAHVPSIFDDVERPWYAWAQQFYIRSQAVPPGIGSDFPYTVPGLEAPGAPGVPFRPGPPFRP